MASGYPDWTRAIRLLGVDGDGNPVTVLLDADGRLYSLIVGQDADGDPLAVRVDDDGQMIMVPRGSSGYYMAVDADGNLTTVLKGTEGANLRPVVVDGAGNLVAVMKGLEGANLRTVAVDASGQMIMVPRGSSGHYMTIDSDGYMTAVLKGAFGEALRTIGLDDGGRITAYMVDDESQWGDVVKVGNAELAARLGSPLAYDWRGKVVAMVDFSRGLGGLYTDTGGAGASVALDPTNFMSGGYSLKMTGGSDAGLVATIFVQVNIPPTDRVGFSINWASDSTFDYLTMWIRVYDGTTQHIAKARFDLDGNQLEYMDDGEAWQTLAAHHEYLVSGAWHSLKLVIDTATNKYVRCLAGKTEHDMSALDLYTSAYAGSPRLEGVIKAFSHTGENEYIWLDSMIVTVGEPE